MLHGCPSMMLGADPLGPRYTPSLWGQPPSRSLRPRPITGSMISHRSRARSNPLGPSILGVLSQPARCPSDDAYAVPELLATLRLEGCIVTLDAMGCQKEIAERIRAKGADYLLVLKANHGHAFEAVREHFKHTCFSLGSGGRPAFDAFEESHGRLVRRRVFLGSSAARGLEALAGWPGRRAVLAVEPIRSSAGPSKVEAETRYFLTSCGDDPAVLARAIRRHWSVENALHWVLDVTFREDDSRVRDRTAARNLALLRKIALNLVAAD